MTAPNRNSLWASVIVEELVAAGVDAVSVAPGSRSTPLTVACYEHDGLQVFSHLDERSAAYFALGRARRTGTPTPLVCTSGTAAANFHPAVIEADRGRVPMVLLTADRPPELRDSGANQTVDQVDLYGDAVRWFRDLPEPEPADRKLRRLRVDVGRAVATATGTPPGPVHCNVPFRKPLEPVEVEDESLDAAAAGLGATGRDGPFVSHHAGIAEPPSDAVERVATAVEDAERVLLVAGPEHGPASGQERGAGLATALADLATASGAPLLADALSTARFGPHVEDCPLVCGGYDAYLSGAATDAWPEPEVVLRVGASPTSKRLRKYLAGTDARQVLVDPAGEWTDAEFATAEQVVADPAATASAIAAAVADRGIDADAAGRAAYRERFERAEAVHWALVDDVAGVPEDAVAEHADDAAGNSGSTHGELPDEPFEGAVVPAVLSALPERATLFASNSMPVRDLDRFAPPTRRPHRALANRGASGVDGIESTALGAASAGDEPVVAIVGDVAFYHDLNGLLAAERCDLDATIVLVNNDGGGIFHALPIEQFDPPFTEAFRTPHGLDFEPAADLYGLAHERVALEELPAACERSVGSGGVDVLEVAFDAEASHRTRESLAAVLDDRLRSRQRD